MRSTGDQGSQVGTTRIGGPTGAFDVEMVDVVHAGYGLEVESLRASAQFAFLPSVGKDEILGREKFRKKIHIE